MTALISLLQTIQEHSQLLLNCLQQEKHALDNNQYEQLCDLAIQKQSLLEQLESLDRQRASNCPESNFNEYIANSHNQPLINQWENTRELILQCQKQNEINGRLLEKRNQLNNETLSILTGRNDIERTEQTYNAKGNQGSNNSLLNGIKA